MIYIDLVNDEEECQNPASLQSLCRLFELPDPLFPPLIVPMHYDTPESPIVGVSHPMDVCPSLSTELNDEYPFDTDFRDDPCYFSDPMYDPLPSPVYTAQELDAALSFLPLFSCSDHHFPDDSTQELRQRLDSIERQYQMQIASLESTVNTFAIDLATLTQGVNQQLARIFDLLQDRQESNYLIHRHTGDILASLACLPALDLRMTSSILTDIQALRRRTLFG